MLELLRCGNYYRGRGGLSHREAKKKPATPKRSGRSERSESEEPLHSATNEQWALDEAHEITNTDLITNTDV
jgi:hypothetical protein